MPESLAICAERLEAGVIHVAGGLPNDAVGTVQVELVYRGEVLATAEVVAGARNQYRAAIPLPAEAISEGVQTYTLRLRQNPEILTHFTVIAGAVLKTDLHAELDQLREEVELLKKAFRRHCAASGPKA